MRRCVRQHSHLMVEVEDSSLLMEDLNLLMEVVVVASCNNTILE